MFARRHEDRGAGTPGGENGNQVGRHFVILKTEQIST